MLSDELAETDKDLAQLISEKAPDLLAVYGVGTDIAGQLLVTAGDNPDRLRSEASFAALCGVSPLLASSGKTNRLPSAHRHPRCAQARWGTCTMSCPSACVRRCCSGRSRGCVTPRSAGSGWQTSTSCAASSTLPCNTPRNPSRPTHHGRRCRSRRAWRSRCRRTSRSGRRRGSCSSTSGATSSRRGHCNVRSARLGRRCPACPRTSASTTCGTTSPACSSLQSAESDSL